jgi:hypothetical protein
MSKKIDIQRIVEFAQGRLSPEDSLRFLEEIEKDPEASLELDLINDLFKVSADDGERLFEESAKQKNVPAGWIGKVLRGIKSLLGLRKTEGHSTVARPVPTFAMAGVVTVLLVVAAFWLRQALKGPFFEDAALTDADVVTSIRTVGPEDFAVAYRMMMEGEYDQSIHLMERYAKAYPTNAMVAYAHYLTGASYLLSSTQNMLLIFPYYDRARVAAGISHLGLALADSTTPRVLSEEARWLRAKGYLRLDRPKDAVDDLHAVELLEMWRARDARLMIARLTSTNR